MTSPSFGTFGTRGIFLRPETFLNFPQRRRTTVDTFRAHEMNLSASQRFASLAPIRTLLAARRSSQELLINSPILA